MSNNRRLAVASRSRERALLILILFSLVAAVVTGIAPLPAALGPISSPSAQAQGGTCPAGSTFLTEFNWSSAPGGNDDPSTDGAIWGVNDKTKTWLDVGGSGLDVTIDMAGNLIDGTNGNTVGPGAVGTIDGFATSTNEIDNAPGVDDGVYGVDGAYGSNYLTVAMFSESSDDIATIDFNFSTPVFFANDFTVDDVDWMGHYTRALEPYDGFQDEVAFTAIDSSGSVPVVVTPLGTATNITGQSAKADVYDENLNGGLSPDDLGGQVLVSTPKPFTQLTLDYSNGPDDQAAELADPNNPSGTWDGVSNGHAIRLGGFTLCEPDPASLLLDKTAYLGHDSGASCTGLDLVAGAVPGENMTYCFEVTNTGTTYLDSYTIDDANLGLTAASVPPLGIVGAPAFPVAPGDTITLYYETGAPAADLLNTATAAAQPTYADGSIVPFQNPVTDDDTAQVTVVSPAVTLVKDVYVGHDTGAGCASATGSAAILPGIDITYCFTVTNSGDTPLTNLDVQDATLGSPTISSTVGPLPDPLLPGESVVLYFETTATTSFTNTAAVTADPALNDGTAIAGATSVTDSDTAVVTEESPSITIAKTVSTDGTCPGVEAVTQVVGDAISYCFTVANTGTTHLANVVIADADIPSFNPASLVPVSGSLSLIAPGASATVRYDTTATVDVQPNTASATGDPSDASGSSLNLGTVTDADTASVDVVAPAIELVKTVVPEGASCSGVDGSTLQVADGTNVVYCFTVSNTGDTDLTSLTIEDPSLGISGLAVTDLASGTSTTVATAPVAATDLTNVATAAGTPSVGATPIAGLAPISDNDDAIVDVLTPGVSLSKTVVGGTDASLCPGVESIDAGSGVGITYCFEVTNSGQSYLDLAGMTFSDTTLGIDATDLVAVGTITDPLPPSGTAMYAFTTTMGTTLTNTASLAADPVDALGDPLPGASPVTDDDIADVVLRSPAISIVKTAYAGHDTGTGCPGTDTTIVNTGASITYCFVVANTSSDAALEDVTIDDPTLGESYPGNLVLLSGDPTFLDIGESAVFYFETTSTSDVTNTADTAGTPVDASGNPIVAPAPTAQDDTFVDVVGAALLLEKTVYLGLDAGASCQGAELATGVNGTDVTYCFTVTNTGDTHLSGVAVSDTTLSVSLTSPVILAPGESVTLFTETTISGDLLNTATAAATPSTSGGAPLPGIAAPSDTDTAEVAEISPAVTIDKTVYNGSDTGASCGTATSSEIAVAGDTVTYCFVVSNTGDTYLDSVTITDPMLDFFDDYSVEQLAPNATFTVPVISTIQGDLKNIVQVSATPVSESGNLIVGVDAVTDSDPSEVAQTVYNANITVENTVYIGDNGGDSCITDIPKEKVTSFSGSKVTYCFRVTNTGETYLNHIRFSNPALSFSDNSMPMLPPGTSDIVYATGIITGTLENVVSVLAVSNFGEPRNDMPHL